MSGKHHPTGNCPFLCHYNELPLLGPLKLAFHITGELVVMMPLHDCSHVWHTTAQLQGVLVEDFVQLRVLREVLALPATETFCRFS